MTEPTLATEEALELGMPPGADEPLSLCVPVAAPPASAPQPDSAGTEAEAQEEAWPPMEEEPSGPPPEEGAPAWVMTFGDLMSLLLTFFILLFSMSSIEEETFQAVAESMVEAFAGPGNPVSMPAPDPIGGEVPPAPSDPGNDPQELDAALEELAERLREYAAAVEGGLGVTVDLTDEGLYVRIPSAGIYGLGSADLAPGAQGTIEGLAEVLTSFGFPAIVSGHTDDVPISSPAFPSNWELSGARAAGVARMLLGAGVPKEDLVVRAYGEYRPLESNDTPEGRAANRRVEIFYTRDAIEARMREKGLLTEPAPADPS